MAGRVANAGVRDTSMWPPGANGADPTFPTWGPHLRLDYAFIPRARAADVRGYRVITEPSEVPEASDHLPILVEVEIARP